MSRKRSQKSGGGRVEAAARALTKLDCWVRIAGGIFLCQAEDAIRGLQRQGFSFQEAKAGIEREAEGGRIDYQYNPDGSVTLVPTPLMRARLQEQSAKPKRKRKWSAEDADRFVRAVLLRAQKDGRTLSVRDIAKETGIPKTTVFRTPAWKKLGSDSPKHITPNTDWVQDTASNPSRPETSS